MLKRSYGNKRAVARYIQAYFKEFTRVYRATGEHDPTPRHSVILFNNNNLFKFIIERFLKSLKITLLYDNFNP